MYALKNGQKTSMEKASCSCSEHNQMTFTKNSLTPSSEMPPHFGWIDLLLKKSSAIFVRFYQYTFSYFFGGNCRYYPSCSDYAIESFEKHNFLKALWLVLKRLSSCHPLTTKKNFYDPVPPAMKGVS